MSHLTNAPVVVEMRNVRVRYPGEAADALSVEYSQFRRGQRVALIGPNGAGKSTLLKALVALLPLAEGTISIFGEPPVQVRKRVAYVPQTREVDWRFPITAYQVVLMGRDAHLKFPRHVRPLDHENARRALAQMGMAELGGRHIAELSGGQRQRVFIARALAQEADLLLLDEPLTGVDAQTEHIIYTTIEQLCRSGHTIIVATHDLGTLAAHFDQVMLLHQRVVAEGTPQEVLHPNLLAAAYEGPLALFYPAGSPDHPTVAREHPKREKIP